MLIEAMERLGFRSHIAVLFGELDVHVQLG
jgi:hypothetical protein